MKKIISVILVIWFIFLFAGCRQNPGADHTMDPISQTVPQTLAETAADDTAEDPEKNPQDDGIAYHIDLTKILKKTQSAVTIFFMRCMIKVI